MRDNEKEVAEYFPKDVEKHVMTVLRDDGLYRHVRFSEPGTSNRRFDLLTWPGHLCYTGDMGTYVFSRIQDMFEFFRGHEPNLQYWAEKVLASDKIDAIQKFNVDVFRARVKEWANDYALSEFEDDDNARALFMEELYNQVFDKCFDVGEESCYALARDFHFDGNYPLQDSWEWNLREYTYRYIWCCYALVWAIAKYDAEIEEVRRRMNRLRKRRVRGA